MTKVALLFLAVTGSMALALDPMDPSYNLRATRYDKGQSYCTFKDNTIATGPGSPCGELATGADPNIISDCALKNITSPQEFCNLLFNGYAKRVTLPYMASDWTTPYVDGVTGCPNIGEPHTHIPLGAVTKGHVERSTHCTLSCQNKCNRVLDLHPDYRKGNFGTVMIPQCYCSMIDWLGAKDEEKVPNTSETPPAGTVPAALQA